MVAWIAYAQFHAILVYFVCLHFPAWPGELTVMGGKELGFWALGHVVYGACVLVANILILYRFNNLSGWGEASVIFMILCFFTILFLENLISGFREVYYIFFETFSNPAIWLSFLWVSMVTAYIELWLRNAQKIGLFGTFDGGRMTDE